ncbi:molybdate transport system ATP-binding protein [Haloactinospora alba]|uniref:ABC-type quaternary amine transporter n=1 Tax=Haloactinospora alba TaxID=405555 RepID=A0A543N7L7_9ACTN|nr:molybdate transport system ATP-binding protein [Haloactinospora alba]
MSGALDARLTVDRGGFRLEVPLSVAPGEVVALLGPNGSGKSTALRALAGLAPLTRGHVTVEGRDVTRTPVESRPVGMVFQDYLLFGHLTAAENVAFGPRCQGVGKHRALERARELLRRMGVAEQAGVKPRRMSGGQQQRVALARALATDPRVLLLDEPLAALDAHTRMGVRAELRRHLAAFGGASVLVTHDPLEAMALADRVTVLEDGAVVQEGPPAEVARRPRTDYVANLVGLNLYQGWAEGTRVRLSSGGGTAVVDAGSAHRGEVFVAFAPSAVALYRQRPEGTPRNAWRLTVSGVERFGDRVRVRLEGELAVSADITPAALAELDLAPGSVVWAVVKATEIQCYPA